MTVHVGSRAREDNVLALASDVASRLMLQSAPMGRKRQVRWLRRELNKTGAGLGDKFDSKYTELTRRGRGQGQALFDALRLTLANFFAANLLEHAARSGAGVSGLGALGSKLTSTIGDIACGVAAFGGAGASAYMGAKHNASGGQAVMNATQQATQMAGCGRKDARIQASIAAANARTAEANAAAAASAAASQAQAGSKKTIMYAAIGGGVLLVGILGIVILKKK